RYYYQHDAVVQELLHKPSRAAEVAALEKELLEMYADPRLDEKPALLEKRGGAYYSEAAVALASSLLNNTGDVQVVNTLNNGTFPFLANDAVIEVPATVNAQGAQPLAVSPLEPLYAGLVAHVTAYEDLALQAAVHGGADRVFQALLAHPLVGQISVAHELTDRLLAHNKAYLPWAR
ncbi:MAG TPA: 6-phospho-beta-glucosidase, partial [Kribbella sp.]|nr:6-phospho-beta-glucosidase [Kribbella sp.]